MKFEEIHPQKQPQIIDEVRMGQSDLDAFINSDDAKGVVMGFEAEMCFIGKGEGNGYGGNMTEDYDQDERADDIDDICNFFYDVDYNGRRQIAEFRDELETQYSEWRYEKMSEAWERVDNQTVKDYIEQNDFDFDDEVMTYLKDELGLSDEQVDAAMNGGDVYAKATSTRQQRELKDSDEAYAHYAEASDHANQVLDDKAEESIRIQDYNYDSAREEWEQEVIDDDDWDQGEWLRDEGVSYMSDVIGTLNGSDNITWPHWNSEDEDGNEFNDQGADALMGTLESALDANVIVGGSHGSMERKPGLWIIEEDPSIDADSGDMPAEIVSPPMPLGQCLSTMKQFFRWARSESAYTNDSTGLHVGVSIPHVGGTVDFVKLALFLGDQYVLEQFGRESNTYCKSALDKISKQITNDADRAATTIELLKHNLIELAAKTLKQTSGWGKYTSINPKGDYIEFRSMGGDYIDKVDEILNTVKRYAYAMFIASRPDLHREEYAKKLYKLLSANGGDVDSLKIFVDRATGKIDRDRLFSELKMRQFGRQQKKQRAADDDQLLRDLQPDAQPEANGGQHRFKIMAGDEQVFIVRATTQAEANQLARDWLLQRSPEFVEAHRGQGFTVVPIT